MEALRLDLCSRWQLVTSNRLCCPTQAELSSDRRGWVSCDLSCMPRLGTWDGKLEVGLLVDSWLQVAGCGLRGLIASLPSELIWFTGKFKFPGPRES
jgi:hypothetical protein